MFNPLVDSFDELTDTQVEEKIQELGRKYWQARNPQLQHQIATILEMYKQEMSSRRAKQMQKLRDNDDSDLDGLINIS